MKKLVISNGEQQYVEMTEQEMREIEELSAMLDSPTVDERIEALEQALLDLLKGE